MKRAITHSHIILQGGKQEPKVPSTIDVTTHLENKTQQGYPKSDIKNKTSTW